MAATYIHRLKDWPKFRWSQERLAERLAAVRHRQGRLIGRMEGLGFTLRAEAVLQTLTEEVIKSSEIECEVLDHDNGRIARAIADMALVRSENSAQRFYSMSAQIRVERKAYYDILEAIQKGGLDITDWLEWFLGCLDRAFDGAETILAAVLKKARFWELR